MPVLDYSDLPDRHKKSLSKSRKLVFGICATAVAVVLGSTLAAQINLNAGAPVEFGQGVAQATACGSITVTPNSSFVNSQSGGEFKFTSLTVSDISQNCSGKDFIIKAYKYSENTPLDLYSTGGLTTYKSIRVNDSNGVFSFVDGGLLPENITSSSASFTVNFSAAESPSNSAVASAMDVDRITIESIVGLIPGSLSFDNTWIGYGPNDSFILGTDDFTIETWAYIPSVGNGLGSFYDTGALVNNSGGFAFWIEGDRLKYRINGYVDVEVPMVVTGSTDPAVPNHNWHDSWHHFAVDRSNDYIRIYVDGNFVAGNSSPISSSLTRNTPYVGALYGYQDGGYTLSGKINSLRVVKGRALYANLNTNSFVPPAILEKVPNTLFLLKADSRGVFGDQSDNHWPATDTSQLPTTVSDHP